MGSTEEELSAWITPPEKAGCIALTLDTTARAYDLRTLKFGRSAAPDVNYTNPDKVFLRIVARTADCFIQFAEDNTVTLDRTAAVAAGSALAETNTYGDVILAGTEAQFTISRSKHKYMHVQGSAAGTLHIRASSRAYPGT